MFSRVRKVLGAGVAMAILGATAVSAAAAPEQPVVQMSRSECVGGFWHVITYDITNPNQWRVIDDQPTDQACVAPAMVLGFAAHLGREFAFGERFHDRPAFAHEARGEEPRGRVIRPEIRSGRE